MQHDSQWAARSPLAGLHALSTTLQGQGPTVRLVEQAPRPALLVAARRGQAEAVAAVISTQLGLAPPPGPRRVANAEAEVLWSGPGQWLVMSAGTDGAGRCCDLSRALAGLAATSEQTDARVLLRLSGSGARRTLMKLVGIDVHPKAFTVDDVAMTPVAHIPSHVWRRPDRDGAPEFEIASGRSTAQSLWHAVVDAASELGLEAQPLQPALAK